MPAEIPRLIQPLLEAYLTRMAAELPGFMAACYLHGSVALGAFNPRLSDIDFITVVSRRCTDHDIQRLTAIHRELEQRYPRWPLQGSYFQWGDLGRFEDSIEPCPAYHDGSLHPAAHHDVNPVTWHVLKTRGVALAGPEPGALDFMVDWDRLIAGMHQNLNTYWRRFIRDPRRIAWLWGDYGIQWAVLGVLRQFYTFSEQDITSKTGAGHYALDHLPERWHRIIHESLNIRDQPGTSLYRFRVARAFDAFRFLTYVIRTCNTRFLGHGQSAQPDL
jgi:hypothetical protein